jgi:ornithine cyclodeaminase/alanine dehydrogenase-like protein (mu-crystallin family)
MIDSQVSSPAFEITKGKRAILLLSEAEVERHLDLSQLLDGLEAGFRQLERGSVQTPPRTEITVPHAGFSLTMSAWMPGMQICVKVVNVFEANLDVSLPNHLGMITLYDPNTGATSCVMDGTYLTGIRTAASAVLSVRMLSRTDSQVATIVGAGVQAREHLRLLPMVRAFERINICSLEYEHARRLAERSELARPCADLQASVSESDVVCLATHSPRPVINAGWVRPGTHVSSVGYYPPDGELPPALAHRSRLVVESFDAFQPAPVGCSDLAEADRSQAATLGAVAYDPDLGRTSPGQITLYKAMGLGLEDMIAANLAYANAVESATATQTMIW